MMLHLSKGQNLLTYSLHSVVRRTCPLLKSHSFWGYGSKEKKNDIQKYNIQILILPISLIEKELNGPAFVYSFHSVTKTEPLNSFPHAIWGYG